MNYVKKPIHSVEVKCNITRERDRVQFQIEALNGAPLTPQLIIDALGDYLLIDPDALFSSQA